MSWEKEALCSHKMNSWCCKICIAAGIDSCGHFRQLWFQWNMCWHQTQLKFQVTKYLDKRSFSQMNCSLVHCKSTVWACSTFPFLLVVSPIMTWDMLSSEMASDQSAVVWSCCRNVNPNKTNSVWDYNLKKMGFWSVTAVYCRMQSSSLPLSVFSNGENMQWDAIAKKSCHIMTRLFPIYPTRNKNTAGITLGLLCLWPKNSLLDFADPGLNGVQIPFDRSRGRRL